MADIVFNIAKGRIAQLATLPAANDAFVVVPLEASNEQTTMGRKTATGVTATVTDASDTVTVSMDDVTWSTASGNAVGAIVVCYDPDTTTGSDADLVPLTKHDFSVTPDGSDIVAVVSDIVSIT